MRLLYLTADRIGTPTGGELFKMSGVYAIHSTFDDRIYVGSSICVWSRWKDHKKSLLAGTHDNQKLQNFVNKYGFNCLVFELLEETPVDELIEAEQYYLDRMKPKFNICLVAGSSLGYRHSAEVLKFLSDRMKGKDQPHFTLYWKGKKQSAEANRKRSETQRGCKCSAESSQKKSEALKKWWSECSAETKAARAAVHIGRKRPKETGEKIAAKLRGRKQSEDQKRTLRKIYDSTEYRSKMSESIRKWWAKRKKDRSA